MRCSTSNIQLETIISRIENGTLNLQPDFQRGEVWSVAKQKKLIDSILRGWRIPPIHVVASDDLIDEVLDGQQRLAAIRDFCSGKFSIDGRIEPRNSEIEYLDGMYYDELPIKVKRMFLKYEISFITLTEYEPSEPAELFDRLNQPMKLTSAEQRNAYMGETRNQIKELVRFFENSGASIETIGFSNSRLAYDEIIAKFCYAIEIKTLRQKIVASNISEKYRLNDSFSDDTIEKCHSTISRFVDIIKIHYRKATGRLKFTKATLYSWLVFIKQSPNWSNNDIAYIMYCFETARSYFKYRSRNEIINQSLDKEMFRIFQNGEPTNLEALLNIFNQRSSMGSTDALSIIYRDIILYVFSCYILNIHDDVIRDYDKNAGDSVLKAVDYIYDKYDWGVEF
ncbi:MAG: DUF262 domain-containing protein [Ruminococcus sp.]|nr:DUF262 domain-containing protein [Ruminococcus sp.]